MAPLDTAPEAKPPEVAPATPEVPMETSAQLEKFREAIARAGMEEQERTAITQNLDALQTKVRAAEAAGNAMETRRLLEEFQQQMDLLLATKKIEEAPLPPEVAAAAAETSTPPETLKEKVVEKLDAIRKDFREGSNWTKAGYIAGGVVGFLAARWLWKKAFGDEKTGQEGFFKKTGKWIFSLGAGLAAMIGVRTLLEKKEEGGPVKTALEGVVSGAEGVAEGTKGALEKVQEAFGPAAQELLKSPTIGPILKKHYFSNEPYASKVEFLAALAPAMLQDGWNVGYAAGRAILISAGEVVFDAAELGVDLTKFVLDPSQAHFKEVVSVYLEGGIMYATSLSAIRALMLRNPIPGLKEVTLWPVSTVSKGGRIVWGFITGDTLQYIQDTASSKTINFWRYAGMQMNDRFIPRKATVEMYEARKEMWKEFSDLVKRTEHNPVASPRTLKLWKNRTKKMLESVTEALNDLEETKKLPVNIREMLQNKFNGQKIKDLDAHSIEEIVRQTNIHAPAKSPPLPPTPEAQAQGNPPEQKMAAGGESMSHPQEKPDLRIAPETLPDDAERVIARTARNADEAMEMRRGASALTKVGVGINTLFLLYEVAQVVQIWKEVGKLEAEGKMDATLKQAAETKRPLALMHTEALAADVIAGGIGSVYVLSGRLALVATGVGGLALIALPLGLSIRAGMYDSIADFELQSGMKLSDRLNGNDEKITGAGKEQQLGTLGSHSLTIRLGAALSSATLEDLEQENAEARKEIIMSMVLEHLRETAPEDYEALLKKLGVNGINGLMNEKVTTTILFPKMGDAFVNRAKTKTSPTPDVEQALRAFNIRRGMFRSNYLSNEDLQEITYEASELLGTWARMEGADDLVAMQQYATEKETEKKEHATAVMKEIFGERADAMMAMSTAELQRLCEKHARMMVNINYIEHSALQNIIKRRQQTPIEADIVTLRERFDALNQFVHVHRHLLSVKIEPKAQRSKTAWEVSPDEAFLKAGTYSVTDEFVAFWGNPHAGDEMFSMNAETIQKESERSQWYDQVLKDYNELMGQTRKAA